MTTDFHQETEFSPEAHPRTACPVNTHNEWDPLEEVIVGRLEGATVASNHIAVTAAIPDKTTQWLAKITGGWKYPGFLLKEAQRELEGFVALLENLGVTVRRPEPVDFSIRFKTPYWTSKGFANACPRDSLLVIGDEIIEAPMAWRCRYFEVHSFRPLLKEYFRRGARWSAAPKPELRDELYDRDYLPPADGEPIRYVINEFEPVFDAADFVRCGTDLFVTRSNVTNRSGIEWLRRHLGESYRIHEVGSRSRHPMHIDTTILPLAPGKLLVNPEYVDVNRLPEVFKSWDILIAPEPDPVKGNLQRFVSMSSRWLSVNVLSIDEKRVIVEKDQVSLMQLLERHGFEPIPCSFASYAPFGGSFHCATLDIRRRGERQCYF